MADTQLTIGIVPDDYTKPGKPAAYDAASGRWADFLREAGCEVRWIDVRSPYILRQIEGCDGFMWRWAHFRGMGRIARRLLPVIERQMGIAVYPDQNTCWHYDDKIAQAWLFDALSIPSPRTWVHFDRASALDWIRGQKLPLVMKLATGAGAEGVVLAEDLSKAERLINGAFSAFCRSLMLPVQLDFRSRARTFVRQCVQGVPWAERDTGYELQAGYALFQEFLDGNDFDTRITVIGQRAFGFRRHNRPGDFRASGSGNVDYDQSAIDSSFVRLAFETAEKLRTQSCAIDGLYRQGEPVIGEVSYTYVSGNVYDCPGHWELEGSPASGELKWVEGHMWPEQAQVEDFLKTL